MYKTMGDLMKQCQTNFLIHKSIPMESSTTFKIHDNSFSGQSIVILRFTSEVGLGLSLRAFKIVCKSWGRFSLVMPFNVTK